MLTSKGIDAYSIIMDMDLTGLCSAVSQRTDIKGLCELVIVVLSAIATYLLGHRRGKQSGSKNRQGTDADN